MQGKAPKYGRIETVPVGVNQKRANQNKAVGKVQVVDDPMPCRACRLIKGSLVR